MHVPLLEHEHMLLQKEQGLPALVVGVKNKHLFGELFRTALFFKFFPFSCALYHGGCREGYEDVLSFQLFSSTLKNT